MESPASELQYERAHITDNATDSIIAANVICSVIAGTAVSLRLISRRLKRLSLGVDDYMAILALLFAFAYLATSSFGLSVGSGKHIILSKDPVADAKDALAAQMIYATGIVPVKLSLIFFYHRIFPNRPLHIALWIVGGVVVSMGIAADLLVVLRCLPLKGIWDHTIKLRCINVATWLIIHASQNVITDFMLVFLPMPLVWRLKMTTTRKIQVSGIFALGAFASVSSIIRITYLKNSAPHYLDATWASVGPSIWSMVELCMGITSACLPTLGPIVSYIRRSPSPAPGTSGRPSVPDRVAPNSVPTTTASTKSTWTVFKMRIMDRSHWDNMFTQLEDPQKDVERNRTPHAPFTDPHGGYKGGMEMVAVRSCGGSNEEDHSLNGIGATTDRQQDAFKLNRS